MTRRLTLLAAVALALAAVALYTSAPHGSSALHPPVLAPSSPVVSADVELESLPARRVAESLDETPRSPEVQVSATDTVADAVLVHVRGRVVAAESGAPLAGVAVYERELRGELVIGRREPPAARFPGPYPPDALTDSQGEFHLRLPAGRAWGAEFAAAGRSPGQATLHFVHDLETAAPSGSADASEPVIEVRLERSARIEGIVQGAEAGDSVEVAFRLSVQRREGDSATLRVALALERRRLVGVLDVTGRFDLPDVPAELPLRLSLVRNHERGRVLLQEPEEPSLAPGSTLQLDWIVGTGGTLVCAVRESDGAPVADTELWLLRPSVATGKSSGPYTTPTATTRTDARGEAVFEDVLQGEWVVALAGGSGDLRDVALVRIPARVSFPREVVHVALVCHRGLTITGRVVDANGAQPTGMVAVRARSETFEATGLAQPDHRGVFSIGPLTPGRYEVRVLGHGRTEPRHVEAGARDVVLELGRRR